ncbi:MAG: hypothetical protein KF799_12470 [Bdellovibrionales bacterium]|nr:hypothetical protein [Bdellovibrionales bacterium]
MGRMHLFEIEDQSWCPKVIRTAITEFLATVTRMTKLWQPTAEVLREILERTTTNRIVVLGAGSGGGILDVVPALPNDTQIVLTDLYPDLGFKSPNPRVSYLKTSVDATAVPKDLNGVRVMYASFHHLTPDLAKQVLANAVKDNQAIAIFEGTERSAKGIFALIFVPILVLLVTPIIRPFRWSRLFLTYILPVLPLAIAWDGLASALRTYSIDEMKTLVADLPSYDWTVEVLKGPRGENLPTLIGIPKS